MSMRFITDLKKYFRYSVVSAKAQLKSEVANSYLNWIWWVLDPLCFMLIYTFVFGYVFNSREQFFPIFIFIGLTMWDFFSKTVNHSVKMVKSNKSIISKVYFPKFILVLTRIWVNGFKMAISFGIVIIMMIVFKVHLSWYVIFSIPILLTLFLLTFGISLFTMHFGVYVADLANVISIVLRFVFYLTGIFYNVESRIPFFGTALNRYNPVAFLLTSMRNVMIYSKIPDLNFLFLWFAVSLALSVLGVRKIYKEENSYVKCI